MGERECHPTFCCWIIAQNRTWYVRDKSRCGSTWQVIWTNVSSIQRTRGSDDVNLLLAHFHRFVLFLILLPSRQQQPREESAFLALYWKRIMRNSMISFKKDQEKYFWYDLWAGTSKHICVPRIEVSRTSSIGEKINLQKGVELKF